jgi:hypothetical protein
MSNNNSNSIYVKAAKTPFRVAAKAVNTAGKITESALNIAESTAKVTENLVGTARDITSSIKDHTKGLTNSTFKIGQNVLSTVESTTKGVSSLAESIAIQAEKREIMSRARANAIKGTSEQITDNQKKKILHRLDLNEKERELNARKRELANKIKKQELNYNEKSEAQKHNLKLLKLNKSSKKDLENFYKGQIKIVEDIAEDINISLEQVRKNICAGKYFSLSLSCKRIKNFNGNSFRIKVARIKELYQIYCVNIVKKLEGKLNLSIISGSLDIFTNYYIEQVQLLTDINNKLLDYINEIMRTITKNTLSDINKETINKTISEFENIIMGKKSKYENSQFKLQKNENLYRQNQQNQQNQQKLYNYYNSSIPVKSY